MITSGGTVLLPPVPPEAPPVPPAPALPPCAAPPLALPPVVAPPAFAPPLLAVPPNALLLPAVPLPRLPAVGKPELPAVDLLPPAALPAEPGAAPMSSAVFSSRAHEAASGMPKSRYTASGRSDQVLFMLECQQPKSGAARAPIRSTTGTGSPPQITVPPAPTRQGYENGAETPLRRRA